jgi:hypothetical protein
MSEIHSRKDPDQPPGMQAMRKIFKRYQKMKHPEIDSDESVLDSRKLDVAHGFSVSHKFHALQLNTVFRHFAPEHTVEVPLEDIAVYVHEDLGR